MTLNVLLYTTTTSQFFKKDLSYVRSRLIRAKGCDDVIFTVKTISAPRNPITIRDSDGDIRFAWDWFETRFVDPVRQDYNAVGFHFTPYYKKKWGLSSRINGSYHNNIDGVLDFWFSCYDEKAKNYDFSEAIRLLLHELGGHGFARWVNYFNAKVHEYDYELNAIHDFPALINFTKLYALHMTLVSAAMQLIEKLKQNLYGEIGNK